MSSLDVTVDATQVRNWATGFRRAPALMRSELVRTTNALLSEGVGIAQENAPVDQGALRASIGVVQAATISGTSVRGAYGSRGIIYARIQEEGGVIVARNAPYLVFRTRDGNWAKVRQVTITGTRYMHRSRQSLEPRLAPAYRKAVGRVLASLGGS